MITCNQVITCNQEISHDNAVAGSSNADLFLAFGLCDLCSYYSSIELNMFLIHLQEIEVERLNQMHSLFSCDRVLKLFVAQMKVTDGYLGWK